jgi:hypothetical protein
MSEIRYATKDNAEGQLNGSLTAVATSIVLNAGEGAEFPQPYTGTTTSGGTSTTLNKTGIGSSGIAVGDYIRNVTDASWAFVKTVSTDSLTTTRLQGGSDNTWQNADEYQVNEFVITLEARNAATPPAVTAREKVLIKNRSTDTLTARTRGYDSSVAQAFAADDYVNLHVTSVTHEDTTDVLYRITRILDDTTTSLADFSSTANGKGASLIGIEDAGGLFTAANVEAALAELAAMSGASNLALLAAQGVVSANFGCAALATYTPTTSIAFDAVTTNSSGSATSHTFAHTCTGSNRYLFVGFYQSSSGSDFASSVTYGGEAMTQLGKSVDLPTGNTVYLYGRAAPASGANNVVITLSSAAAIGYSAFSYTGCHQTAQPTSATVGTQAAGTTVSVTPTSLLGNDWLAAFGRNGESAFAAGANTELRGSASSFQACDSNATGIRTLNLSWTGSGMGAVIGIALVPVSSSPAVRVLDYDKTSFEQAEWQVLMPDSYAGGTFTAKVHWLTTAASGNAVWRVQAVGVPDATSLPATAPYGAAQSVTDGSTGANFLNVSAATAAVTPGGSPGASRMMWFRVARDAAHASDTLDADARLVGLEIIL